MERNPTPNICSSVFKSGETQTTTQAFTQMWIAMIEKLEKSKGTVTVLR